MPARGAAQLAAIAAVAETFGQDTERLVFVGSCVLALYARPAGAPLLTTKDVDCISTITPWIEQLTLLRDLCERGVLVPDFDLACRYTLKNTGTVMDVISPDGFNTAGVNSWFPRAVLHAGRYLVRDGCWVKAVTPPYFLATKLVALEDRGTDLTTSTDAEDIVTLIVEVPDLVVRVEGVGILSEIRALFAAIKRKHGLLHLEDLVDYHLHPDEEKLAGNVHAVLAALS